MGVVVAARHVELARRMTLKFVLPQVYPNAEAVGSFLSLA